MLKQISIFIVVFIASVALIILLSNGAEDGLLEETTFHSSNTIDPNLNLSFHMEYNDSEDYNMSNDELVEFSNYRIRIYESEDLTDTIEIYTINIYDEITDKAEITVLNNEINFLNDFGPISTYKSVTFLPYLQFDHTYIQGVTYSFYEVHIPVGASYTID